MLLRNALAFTELFKLADGGQEQYSAEFKCLFWEMSHDNSASLSFEKLLLTSHLLLWLVRVRVLTITSATTDIYTMSSGSKYVAVQTLSHRDKYAVIKDRFEQVSNVLYKVHGPIIYTCAPTPNP